MSIAPPSDIVLDVAQAADPAKRQAAVERLAAMAAQGGSPPVDFATALGSTTPTRVTASDPSLRLSPLQGRQGSQIPAGHGSAYRKFEAMVLQSFMSSILPKNTELFGDSASADMCRSMLAEKLADQLAKSGRIGIAKQLEKFETSAAASVKPKEG